MKVCSIEGCERKHVARGWCAAHWMRWKRHGDPLQGGTAYGDPRRYYEDVVLVYQGTECLIWPFGRDGRGYAQIGVGGRMRSANRLVCEKVRGPPPTPKHEAAHLCGKGHLGCITPGHLDWKTRAANDADKIVHGTHNRGERHPSAKLTEADVHEIRSLQGVKTQSEIASLFGIRQSTVSTILSGQKWAHIARHGA